jgi:hypothetical protein
MFISAATVAAAVIALLLGAVAHSTPPSRHQAIQESTRPPQLYPGLGCGDTPTLDGRSNTPHEDILCGSSGNDIIHAGKYDVVLAFGGDDKIYSANGGPNLVDGGSGYDRAWTDSWDTLRGIQQRFTSAARRAAARADTTFNYNLPTVSCSANDQGGYQIELLDFIPPKPQLSAYNANPGVVDWQYVAWSTLIYKWDPTNKNWFTWNPWYQTEWLWDRTFDNEDYPSRHPANVWHSFVQGQDDQEADEQPIPISEPGDYLVRFRYYWFPAAALAPNLAPEPLQSLWLRSREVTGDYVSPAKSPVTGKPFYCKFP